MKFTFSDYEYIMIFMIAGGAEKINLIKAIRAIYPQGQKPSLSDSKQAAELIMFKFSRIGNDLNVYKQMKNNACNGFSNPSLVPTAAIEI